MSGGAAVSNAAIVQFSVVAWIKHFLGSRVRGIGVGGGWCMELPTRTPNRNPRCSDRTKNIDPRRASLTLNQKHVSRIWQRHLVRSEISIIGYISVVWYLISVPLVPCIMNIFKNIWPLKNKTNINYVILFYILKRPCPTLLCNLSGINEGLL